MKEEETEATAEEVAEQEHEESQQQEEELVAATQKRMSVLGGDMEDDDDDEQTEESEEESESTPAEEEEEGEEEQAGEEEEEEESTSEEETVEEETETEDGLPDAFLRAAVHQGWDEKEVKEFFEKQPELALKTFAKIHESTNKLSAEFARLGRVDPKKETPVAEVKTATEANKATEEDETLKQLKEEYGEDSIMVKAFASMQVKLAEATKVQEKVAPTPEPDSAVQATVDKFFTDPALKPYVNFYGEGKVADKLTVGQMNNRWAMLEMADRIIAGSESQGREVTPEVAMEMAHLSVSEKHRTEALRVELKSKVKKRANGVTLKPAKSKKVVTETDAKKTDKQLEVSVGNKLKSMF